jgi:hypothetical protein
MTDDDEGTARKREEIAIKFMTEIAAALVRAQDLLWEEVSDHREAKDILMCAMTTAFASLAKDLGAPEESGCNSWIRRTYASIARRSKAGRGQAQHSPRGQALQGPRSCLGMPAIRVAKAGLEFLNGLSCFPSVEIVFFILWSDGVVSRPLHVLGNQNIWFRRPPV